MRINNSNNASTPEDTIGANYIHFDFLGCEIDVVNQQGWDGPEFRSQHRERG